ncbi:hypothetical protein, partial [Vibrio mediterranei]|uniref:hypothetical protein n=1 Tax=Vibrio mediterranei TaxID=689 RepID=UPI001C10CE70
MGLTASLQLYSLNQENCFLSPINFESMGTQNRMLKVKLPPAKPEAYWMTPSKGLILRPRRGSFTSLGL